MGKHGIQCGLRQQLESDPPEHLIQSAVGHIGTLEFQRGPEGIEAGRQAARAWREAGP